MQDKTGASLSSATTSGNKREADVKAHRAPSRRHLALVAATAALVLVLDQSAKAWALHSLKDGAPRNFLGSFLRFQLTFNPGAAFSLGTNSTILITAIAIAVVVVLALSARRLRSSAWAVAFGLIMGGALGNLGDRFFREPGGGRGHVVDFLELPHWPTFNLADSAICCAAALVVYLSFRGIGLDGVKDSDRKLGDSDEVDPSDKEQA